MSVRNFMGLFVVAVLGVAIADTTGDESPSRRAFTFEVIPVLETTEAFTSTPSASLDTTSYSWNGVPDFTAALVTTTAVSDGSAMTASPEDSPASPAGVGRASAMVTPVFAPTASIATASTKDAAAAASISTASPEGSETTTTAAPGLMQAAMPLLSGAEHMAGEADKQFENAASNLLRLAAGKQDESKPAPKTSEQPTISPGEVNFTLENAKAKLAQAKKEKTKIEAMLSDVKSKTKPEASKGKAHASKEESHEARADEKHDSLESSKDAPQKTQETTTAQPKSEAKDEVKSQSSSEANREPAHKDKESAHKADAKSNAHALEDMAEAKKLYSVEHAMQENFATGFQGSGVWLSCAAVILLALLLGVVRVIALQARSANTARQTATDEESALE